MRRANELVAEPTATWQKRCLCEWFVANCALWNEVTYHRRQEYFAPDGDVWAAETSDLYEEYAPVTGTGTAQQVKRKNDDAWKSFFAHLEEYHAGERETKPSPPGYWGNRREGYDLRGLVRGDLYDIEGGDGKHSHLLLGVGTALKDKYGLGTQDRLRLRLQGAPRWRGEDCQLELAADETADCIRVHHTVSVQPGEHDQLGRTEFTHTPNQGNAKAAIDVGANNTLTVLTDQGDALVFQARDLFAQFRATTEHRAALQARLPDERDWSERLQRVCTRQYRRRDHQRDAALKHVARWLLARGVSQTHVGDLTDVLSTHWCAAVNEKTHNFWSHRQLVERLSETFTVAGIELAEVDEAESSSVCPHCDAHKGVTRCGDSLHCPGCGLEAHADVAGSRQHPRRRNTTSRRHRVAVQADGAARCPRPWTGVGRRLHSHVPRVERARVDTHANGACGNTRVAPA